MSAVVLSLWSDSRYYQNSMTLDEFRSDKQLVAQAAALLQASWFQQLLEALRESHPKNFRAQGDHVGDNAHHKLGRIYGYDEFESNLLSAAKHNPIVETPLASTFKSD